MSAPGKAHREGISLIELGEMFPDEATAAAWFESLIWPDGRHCPRCGSTNTHEASATSGLPYRCGDCKRTFSVKIGTALERSRIPLRKWAFAIYLELTSLKGVSSMKLHRDLRITQKTAWFMLHRIREAFANPAREAMAGPVEADETYMGGKRRNMSNAKRRALKNAGRGAVGKAAIVGTKDRATNRVAAQHVPHTDTAHVAGFVADQAKPGAKLYTDEAAVYHALKPWYDHEAVNHGVGEYVRGQAHTNGMESFWSMLKRGYVGTYHKLSPKHLQRYVSEFAGRHNIRESDTIAQMASVVAGMVGKRLMYRDLIADNGLSSGARSA